VLRIYTKNIEVLKNIYVGAPSIHEDHRDLNTIYIYIYIYISAESIHEDY